MVSIFVLICVTSASTIVHSTFSYPAAADNPDNLGHSVNDASHSYRSLSSSNDTKIDDIEERGHITQMFGSIKGFTTRYMYSEYAKKVRQYGSLEEALKSDKMEALYNLCIKHNRKNKAKNQLSAVKPLLEAYGRDDMPNKLRNVLENEGYNKLMIKHLLRETWLIERMSIDEVFDLLQFGDDLTIAIQTGKFDDLKEYILLLVRIKYNDKVSEYVDDELVKILTSRFGGDGNFVEQLRKAKFSGVDDESVSGLESALFRTWHGLSELAVWNRLQFGNDAVEALTSGKVEIADKYFTQKNTDGQFFAISRLENNFGEMGVTVALATAKLEPATKEFATMMQHKQIRCWVQYEASVDLVFTSLHFKMDGDINLNVKLEALSSFISLKNRAQPYVKAGDLWGLASLAVKANAGDDPAQLLQHADKILHLVFAKWKSESLRPKELFNQFHGKTLPADLFDSAIVLQYSDFYKDYNSMVIPSFTKPRRS